MAAPRGHARYGGRVKGQPNKKTQTLMELCESNGINPFERLLQLTDHNDVNIRLQALKEVCQYLYPKRKALEVSAEVKTEIEIKGSAYLDEVRRLLTSQLKERK